MSELKTRSDFLKQLPKSLFKFQSFKSYTKGMLEEPYLYLAPVGGLDDPFECLNDSGLSKYFNADKKGLTPAGLQLVINKTTAFGNVNKSDKETISRLATEFMEEDGGDIKRLAGFAGTHNLAPSESIDLLPSALEAIDDNFSTLLDEVQKSGFFGKALSPDDSVGVCSLSETRDNKVMWSQYGKTYEGLCIEYAIPRKPESFLNLFPVIYTKRKNNNLVEKLFEYAHGGYIRALTGGAMTGNIGAVMELFCTKDSDWAYQREWRIIDSAKGRVTLPIKAVYIGFKAKAGNIARIKSIAKKKGFSVYLMNPPRSIKTDHISEANLTDSPRFSVLSLH